MRGHAWPRQVCTAFCNFDADDNGTQQGLNPTLILQGDLALQRIVTAIKASRVWSDSRSAIVILLNNNDYQHASPPIKWWPSSTRGKDFTAIVQSARAFFYDHYTLTKTLDAAFRLPCLNHACDAGVEVMSDLFRK